ncbi:MAG: hypothetical protein AAFY41_08060 [Bacteroidota bacterium]
MKITYLFILMISSVTVIAQNIIKVDLNKYLPTDFEINSFSLTLDGKQGFITAGTDWKKQYPYLLTFGKDTIVQLMEELNPIYNGAISPSGNQIIYSTRKQDSINTYLIIREYGKWNYLINLSSELGITGGYFYWRSEQELYFSNRGDILRGRFVNDSLRIDDPFDGVNTQDTEFSPFVSKNKDYLIFTRYSEDDSSQQGLMISYNKGTEVIPKWTRPKRIKGLPYGWGAFVFRKKLYYSDGNHIYSNMFTE